MGYPKKATSCNNNWLCQFPRSIYNIDNIFYKKLKKVICSLYVPSAIFNVEILPVFIAMAVSADAEAPELNPPPELPGTEALAPPGFDLQWMPFLIFFGTNWPLRVIHFTCLVVGSIFSGQWNLQRVFVHPTTTLFARRYLLAGSPGNFHLFFYILKEEFVRPERCHYFEKCHCFERAQNLLATESISDLF